MAGKFLSTLSFVWQIFTTELQNLATQQQQDFRNIVILYKGTRKKCRQFALNLADSFLISPYVQRMQKVYYLQIVELAEFCHLSEDNQQIFHIFAEFGPNLDILKNRNDTKLSVNFINFHFLSWVNAPLLPQCRCEYRSNACPNTATIFICRSMLLNIPGFSSTHTGRNDCLLIQISNRPRTVIRENTVHW